MKTESDKDVVAAVNERDTPLLSRRALLAALGGCATMTVINGCSKSTAPAPDAPAGAGPLHYRSLTEVGRLIEAGDLSPVELTRTMLDRIDTLDTRLHSYAAVFAEHALAAARRAEDDIRRGNYRGPLHGVPIAVKDLFYTAGKATRGGLKVRGDFVPEFDATAVSRLQAAGAVLLGKLATTEGAMVGYHRDVEIPVNPWGENLWAGVSSSGSGVATAAGLCFGSLGTDTGGSIRFPATANGIVGLKPTYGRVSRHGVLPLAESLDHVGPLTRSVADAAIMLQAMAGFDPNDPTSLEAPVPDMQQAMDRGIEGLRIGFDRSYALGGVPSGLAAAVETAVENLARLGADVVEVEVPDVSDVVATWPKICAAEAVEAHLDFYPARADEYGEYFREFLAFGAAVGDDELAAARKVRQQFNDRFRAVLASVDAIASPASGIQFPIEPGLQYGSMTLWRDTVAEIFKSHGAEKLPTSFTFPHNYAGTPTLSLPCGISDAGLPYTLQLAGSALSEATLCRIGYAFERATKWHDLHPPV